MLDSASACFRLDPCVFDYSANQLGQVTGFFGKRLFDELKPREIEQSLGQRLHAKDIFFDSGEVTANLLWSPPSPLEQNSNA